MSESISKSISKRKTRKKSSTFFGLFTTKRKEIPINVNILSGGKIHSNFSIDPIKHSIGNRLNHLYNKFVKSVWEQKLTKSEDIRYKFEKMFCNKSSIFENVNTKCGSGGFKTVIICKKGQSNKTCNYVYMFDFKKHDNDMGDDMFMHNGTMDLSNYPSIGASPLYFKSLYLNLSNNSRIRIDFMIQPNFGAELFEFLFIPKNKYYTPGSKPNLALSLIFLLTTLHTFIILHSKGITHRDLKPENINIGDLKNTSLIVIDFGLALTNKFPSKDYSYAGTLDYFTPRIAEKVIDDKIVLKYDDYYDLDLHSIGINILNIMCMSLLKVDGQKFKECPGKNAFNSDSKQMCQYLLCHYKDDGTLGFEKKVNNIKYKDRDMNDLFNMVKIKAIQLCQYGFSVYSEKGSNVVVMKQMYNEIIATLKLKKSLLTIFNSTPIKLNNAIMKDIDPTFTYLKRS